MSWNSPQVNNGWSGNQGQGYQPQQNQAPGANANGWNVPMNNQNAGPPNMGAQQWPNQGQQQMNVPQQNFGGVAMIPKIFVRADGVESFMDVRIIFPSDRFPGVNFAGKVIGAKGVILKKLQTEHRCKLTINTPEKKSNDETYIPNVDPPHLRVQSSGPLHEIFSRLSGLCKELQERFDPDYRDPTFDPKMLDDGKTDEDGTEKTSEDADQNVDGAGDGGSDNNAGRGGYRGRGRGRGRGSFRGGYGGGPVRFDGTFNNTGFQGGRGRGRGGYGGAPY